MISFFRKAYQNTIGRLTANYREQVVIEKYEMMLDLGQQQIAKSAHLANEILALGTEDLSIKANCYQILAYHAVANNDMEQGKFYYEFAEKLLNEEDGDLADKAILHMEMATYCERLHQYDKALEHLERAEQKSISSDDIALTLNILSLKASIYLGMRDRLTAEMLLKKIIYIREDLKHFAVLSSYYSELGDLYENFDEQKNAEECFLKALQYIEYGDRNPYLIYYDLINFYRRNKDYDKVQFYIEQVNKDADLQENPNLQLIIFQYLVEAEKLEEALQLHTKIEEVYLTQHFISQLTLYATSFRLFRKLNDFDTGKKLFDKCLPLVAEERLFEAKWLLFDIYGEFLRHFDKHEEALKLYEQSAKELLQFRQTIAAGVDRIDFFEDKVEYLNFYAEYAIELKYYPLALFFLESAKGQSLIDLLDSKRPLKVLSFEAVKAIL
ncbi:MAG: hypothetical protein ACPG49_07230 [Chitinophagales bacterium]